MDKKKCDTCQLWLPFCEFNKNKSKLDGYQNNCRECLFDYKKKSSSIKIKNRKEEFYIPDIYLVGIGRTQTYQNCCLHCQDPFFCLIAERTIEDLFCDNCQDFSMSIPERNISKINFVGNVVGWLAKFDSASEKRKRKNYKKIYQRDRFTCQYCGYNLENAKKFLPLHIDHIKPWSAQGGNSESNLVVSCQECNLIASDKWFSSFHDKKEYITIERKYRKSCS